MLRYAWEPSVVFGSRGCYDGRAIQKRSKTGETPPFLYDR